MANDGPPRLLRGLFEPFAHPRGFLGRLAGALMARDTTDDRWMVDLLDVQPDDRVLEAGFGPGVALGMIAARARVGFVAGVDPSDIMVRQATERNRSAVASGQVELRVGTVTNIPYPDAHFTKACAIHSLYFWEPLDAALRELFRVLAPGGLLILVVRTRRPNAGPLNPSRYGLTDEQIAAVVGGLEEAGFTNARTKRQNMARQTLAAILAHRPRDVATV